MGAGSDMGRLREVARRAALRGGDVVRAGASAGGGAAGARGAADGGGAGVGGAGVDAKGLPGDWVTEVDIASERAIAEILAAETPDVPVQGEEAGGVEAGRRWVVDPLDGTTNFIHRFPAVGVAVALVDDRRVEVGAVHAPFLGETWHAAAGAGGWWEGPDGDGHALAVSERPWSQAVIGTGFPFRRKERLDRYLAAMRRVLADAEDLRRPGAAALDLAWVASGVFDGFFELGLAPWDVAAGALLIQEAGGVVSDWDGGDGWLDGDIVAGGPGVWEELVARTSGG